MSRITVLFAIALMGACRPLLESGVPTLDVVLAVEPAAVSAGDSITLTLRNRSSGSLGYNLCLSELEWRSDGEWQPIPLDRICTLELRSLDAGGKAGFPVTLPEGLAPGSYRFRTTVEILEMGVRDEVWSRPFQVSP